MHTEWSGVGSVSGCLQTGSRCLKGINANSHRATELAELYILNIGRLSVNVTNVTPVLLAHRNYGAPRATMMASKSRWPLLLYVRSLRGRRK